MSKTALILSGGGLACAYSAGGVYSLVKEHNLTHPEIVIGGSGGTGTLSYYVSEQYESINNIWTNLLSTKKFVNFLRPYRIMNIDYLIDDIFGKQDVLDQDQIFKSPIEYLISATNIENGDVEYFSNKRKDNTFEAMRASMAMPIAYNKIINVKHKQFCDTHLSASAWYNLTKAVELGAKKIIIFDIKKDTNKIYNKLYEGWMKKRNKKFKMHYLWNMKKFSEFHFPEDITIINLSPEKKLQLDTFQTKQEELKKIFLQGYNETKNSNRLKEFLNK